MGFDSAGRFSGAGPSSGSRKFWDVDIPAGGGGEEAFCATQGTRARPTPQMLAQPDILPPFVGPAPGFGDIADHMFARCRPSPIPDTGGTRKCVIRREGLPGGHSFSTYCLATDSRVRETPVLEVIVPDPNPTAGPHQQKLRLGGRATTRFSPRFHFSSPAGGGGTTCRDAIGCASWWGRRRRAAMLLRLAPQCRQGRLSGR